MANHTLLLRVARIFQRNNPKLTPTTLIYRTVVSKENDYAHSVLRRLPHLYGNNLAEMIDEFNDKTTTISAVREFHRCDRASLTKLCRSIVDDVSRLTDDQLSEILSVLWKRGGIELDVDLKRVLTAVDVECVARLSVWDLSRALRTADYFYRVQANRVSRFHRALIGRLASKKEKEQIWLRMNCRELIQLLFYINLQRECDSHVMKNVEEKLLGCLSNLSSEEIAVAAFAFFKTQNPITSLDLLNAIIDRFRKDIDVLPDFAVSAFGKLIRYSSQKAIMTERYVKLLDTCVPYVNRWTSAAALNVGLITTTAMIDHKSYSKAMAENVLNRLPDVRLKEMTDLLVCMATFNYEFDFMPNLNKHILDELKSEKRQNELKLYPGHLVEILLSLAFHEIFPLDLIKRVMNPEYYRRVTEKTKYSKRREYFALDCTLRLECPAYDGPRLDSKIAANIWKADGFRIPTKTDSNLSFYEKFLLAIKDSVAEKLGGHQFATIAQLLPHYRLPDILVNLDFNGQPMVIDNWKNSVNVQYPPTDRKSLCIMFGGRSYYTQNSKRYLGNTMMKLRQLKRLGYQIIEIPYFKYFSLAKNERSLYIHEKMQQYL